MKRVLLGFDIGTLSSKGVLVDLEGTVLAEAGIAHEIIREASGWAEHRPREDYWEKFVAIVGMLLDRSGVDPHDIGAIGVDGLVPTMLPVDGNGEALRNAVLYLDNRAVGQLEEANGILSEPISLEQVVPKMMWFRDHEPELYEKTAGFTLPHSYVVEKLTGARVIDVDTANAYGGIFDPDSGVWKPGVMERLGLDPARMPQARPATDIAGRTGDRAAKAGLPAGIPVIVGTGDSFSSLLGYGVIHKGDMMIYLGTAGTQIMCKKELEKVADTIHVSDKGRAVEFRANMIACGQALEWFRKEVAGGVSYDDLNREAALLNPGSEKLITLPHFMGIRTPMPDPLACGTLFGLTLNHGHPHMYRSLIEGITYGMKEGMDSIASQVKRVVVTGGGSRSALWCQILSDCLNRPVEVPSGGGAALGIAYLAGRSVGVFDGFTALEEKWVTIGQRFSPDPENHARYEAFYRMYLELNGQLAARYRPLYEL